MLKSYQIVSDIYYELGDFGQAYIAQRTLNPYKEYIFSANQATTFSYYQTLYETEQKELEILTKTHQIDTIKARNTARLRTIASIVLSLLVIGV